MPREQFIAPAGVAAGGPFFCWVSFRWTSFWWFSFCWVSSRGASFLVGFLLLGLPGRSGFATLQGRSISRPFFRLNTV